MSTEVQYVPFGELLKTIVDNRGRSCPTSESGIPLIATNCIKNDSLYPVFEKVRFVSQHTFDKWFRGHPQPDDIIFVNKGTPGRVCLVPNPLTFCIAQDMVAIRADEHKIYPKYLFAALRSNTIQNEIENLHVGSLIPHFKKGDFNALQIPVPNKSLQIFIGDLYYKLSLRLDLLNRQNKTLEEMAETLFRQWFVEEPSASNSSALEDWIYFDPKEKLDKSKQYQMFEMKCLSNDSMSIDEGVVRDVSSATMFRNGDTLLAKITPCLENGKTGLVMLLEEDEIARGSTEFIVLRTKGDVSPYWIYCLARDKEFHDTAVLSMTGTSGRQRVQVDILKKYPVKVQLQTMDKFHSTVKPFFEKIRSSTVQIRNLTKLRDVLLPALMNGTLTPIENGQTVNAYR